MLFTQRDIESIARRFRSIELIYLFGSHAKRRAREKSDIDIAVLLRKPLPAMKDLAFRVDLASALEQCIKQTVDVVILNTTSVALKQQVLKYGKLLFERKPGIARNFFITTVTAYHDYLPLLRFFSSQLPGAQKEMKHG